MRKRKRGKNLRKHGAFAGLYASYSDYRYGEQTDRPIRLAGTARPKPILSEGKRKDVVARLVEQMGGWRLSPFENEGPLVHGVRSNLCLDGNGWGPSDAEAMGLVEEALRTIGVPRPSWDQGQPDYLDAPDRCTWCGGNVDDVGNGKASRYCSPACAKAAMEGRNFTRRSETDRAYAAAARMLKRSRTTVRHCEECAQPFQPVREKSAQRFCSFSCGAKSRMRSAPPCGRSSIGVTISCDWCGYDFEARDRSARFCSKRCSQAASKAAKGRLPTILKPHVFDHYIGGLLSRRPVTADRLDAVLWQAGAAAPGEVYVSRACRMD